MRILITGGAGFIGSHLCERLLKEGNEVDVIDDLSTGNIENLKNCVGSPKFGFINDTVINENIMYTLIDKCDMVYHLAAAVGVDLIVKQPVRTIETNIKGTEVVLDITRKFNKKVLLASTSEVYGKNEKVPFREDDDSLYGATTYSRWSYACSKAIDEFLAIAYHRQFGLQVVITRLFNTVGERQTGQYGMVIPRFIKAALSGDQITIYGDGKQTRCFAYVQDIIEGMVLLVNDPGSYGNVYNIGATHEISIEALAKKIKDMTGSSSEIAYLPYEKAYGQAFDDMRRRIPSLEKIEAQVGYKPDTSLDRILERIIDYFRREVIK
jgi:UDP-glucose 4-epimerase